MEKVNIKYMSDLHVEFGSSESYICQGDINEDPETVICNFDILAIAGDVNNARYDGVIKSLTKIAKLIYPKPLVYVTGNHDYYFTSVSIMNMKLRKLELEIDNLYFLNHRVLHIDRQTKQPTPNAVCGKTITMMGATGWQNADGFAKNFTGIMNDFNLIDGHARNVKRMGNHDFKFLSDTLRAYKSHDVVVLTHISPSEKFLDYDSPEVYSKGHSLGAYFNDWTSLLDNYKPNVWITGHIHDCFDETYKDTRMLRNGHGYVGTMRYNKFFDKCKTVEV